MVFDFPPEVERIARRRIADKKSSIGNTLDNVAAGVPLASETDSDRLIARLMSKNEMTRDEATVTCKGIRAFAEAKAERRPKGRANAIKTGGAEAIWGPTIDFVGVAFLDLGRRAANAVARVAFDTGRGWGSGFMVTNGLFLTNNHVIPTAEAARDLVAEFDFELDISNNLRRKTSFSFDPGTFFMTDSVEGLDFTLIALGQRIGGAQSLPHFGYCPLSDAGDKHAIGEVVNIVQHPNGRYKEVVLRENRLVARGDEALHYVADTEPGSSGSPVFNNQWQPIALHHWGGPNLFQTDDKGRPVPREINEGIRISSIVRKIRSQRSALSDKHRAMADEALRLWDSLPVPPSPIEGERSQANFENGPRANADGSVSWVFPLEITVRAPLIDSGRAMQAAAAVSAQPAAPSTAERALRPSTDYSDRGGYEPGFIPGHSIPLPKLSPTQRAQAARNRQAGAGDDEFELKYHHYSSVVSAKRKMAFYTACNIDGRKAKYINRRTGDVEPLDPANTDHGLMEAMLAEGAEASEQWFNDERLTPGDCADQSVYDAQNIPGFPTSSNPLVNAARTLRMFQRGHLVRRLDPAWGTNEQALLAEADTFHFSNCAPQVGFFNMGQAQASIPGSGGGKLWRAVENLVLRNARTMRKRVISFSGPIFGSNDRKFRTIKIPRRFFKIAVWADNDGLRSLGMIADQGKVFDAWPEALFTGEARESVRSREEAFQDANELARVDDFLTTIEDIEEKTRLDFGNAVRRADIRAGESLLRPQNLEEVSLTPRRSKRAKPKGASRKRAGSRGR